MSDQSVSEVLESLRERLEREPPQPLAFAEQVDLNAFLLHVLPMWVKRFKQIEMKAEG